MISLAPPYYYQNDGRYGVTQDQGEVYSLSQDLYNPLEASGGGGGEAADLGIIEATSSAYGISDVGNPHASNGGECSVSAVICTT